MKCSASPIKYVAIELTLNTKKFNKQASTKLNNKLEYGLLKGLKVEFLDESKTSVTTYLTILKDGKTNRIANLKYFCILTIEIYDGVSKEIIFYSDENQEAAFNKIVDIMGILKEHKMLTDNESVVDTSKYEDIPKNLGDRYGTVPSVEPRTNNIYTPTNTVLNKTIIHKTTVSYANPTMFMFKRRSKKPTKEILKSMKQKILQIASGDYKPPVFKKIKGENEKTKNGKVDDDREFFRGY